MRYLSRENESRYSQPLRFNFPVTGSRLRSTSVLLPQIACTYTCRPIATRYAVACGACATRKLTWLNSLANHFLSVSLIDYLSFRDEAELCSIPSISLVHKLLSVNY